MQAVKYTYQEWADNPYVFATLPGWLKQAVEQGRIVAEFGGEDYWYMKVETDRGPEYVGPDDYICHQHGNLYTLKFEETR